MTVLPNLLQENEALRVKLADMASMLAAASKPKTISLKVTAAKLDPKSGDMKGSTGAISIYGLGRFPITLYRSQLERLLAEVPTIKAFITTNAHLLATKG